MGLASLGLRICMQGRENLGSCGSNEVVVYFLSGRRISEADGLGWNEWLHKVIRHPTFLSLCFVILSTDLLSLKKPHDSR